MKMFWFIFYIHSLNSTNKFLSPRTVLGTWEVYKNWRRGLEPLVERDGGKRGEWRWGFMAVWMPGWPQGKTPCNGMNRTLEAERLGSNLDPTIYLLRPWTNFSKCSVFRVSVPEGITPSPYRVVARCTVNTHHVWVEVTHCYPQS